MINTRSMPERLKRRLLEAAVDYALAEYEAAHSYLSEPLMWLARGSCDLDDLTCRAYAEWRCDRFIDLLTLREALRAEAVRRCASSELELMETSCEDA